MKKVISIIASCFLLVFCFTFVSCGASNPQGTYKLIQEIEVDENGNMNVKDLTNEDYSVTLNLNKDGSGTMVIAQKDSEEAEPEAFTWKLDGNELSITIAGATTIGYFNNGLLYNTTINGGSNVTVYVYQKQTKKITDFFKKKEKTVVNNVSGEATISGDAA